MPLDWLSNFYIFELPIEIAMKKLLLSVVVIAAIGASFAFRADTVHLKGYIEDSMCASSKTPMSPVSDRITCVKKCFKMGAKAVLVSDGKVYQIANQKTAIPFAGKDVSVDGTLTNDSIQISNIAESK
jgi:hypothetical protein